MTDAQFLNEVREYLESLIRKVIEDVEKDREIWRREREATGL